MKFNAVYNKENHLVLTLSDQRGGAQALPAQFALIQHSYRFLDSKFNTFSRLFSTTIISFSRRKGIEQVINKGTMLFFMTHCSKNTGEKTQDFFLSFFHTLFPFSRLFSGLENCWENFTTVSRIQDSVQTLLKQRFMMSTGLHLAFGPHPSLSY